MMDNPADPDESTNRGRIGPLGDEAIEEAEAEMGGGRGVSPAPNRDRDRGPDHDPSSHGAGPGGEDDLSVISDTDVPGSAG